MLQNETDPQAIVASLIEKYRIDPDPKNWSVSESKRVKDAVSSYVIQLGPDELTKLILKAENETASVEEFIETLCHMGKDYAGDRHPDWLTLLQAMAGFIVLSTLGSRPLAVVA